MALLGALLIVLALPDAARAATFKVTNTNDSGPGSLRTAISHANHNGKQLDKIPIKATGTIGLDRKLPRLHSDLVVRGPGARKLTVRAPYKSTLTLFVNWGKTVRMSRITITGSANVAVGNALGGTFTVSHLVLRRNDVAVGNLDGTLIVSRSTVSDNKVGILQDPYAVMPGTLIVSRSTVSGNGHAIENREGGTLIVSRSTLSDSHLIVANYDYDLSDPDSDRPPGTVAISQSTLSGSSRHRKGGSILNERHTETTLQSTIIANSLSGNCGGPGQLTSLGHNLADDDTCNLTAEGDQPNTNPLLRPLDDYGGPTRTFALRPSSPAVDAGVADGATTDQRGLPRVVDYPGVPTAPGSDGSDIGAFELQVP